MPDYEDAGLGERQVWPLRKKAIEGAVKRLKAERPIGTIRDAVGPYATDFKLFYLVAKSKILLVGLVGGIVSVQEELVNRAIETGKPIVMYLEENDAYYGFEPKEILANSERNEREGIGMLNFNIRLGKNLEGPKR